MAMQLEEARPSMQSAEALKAVVQANSRWTSQMGSGSVAPVGSVRTGTARVAMRSGTQKPRAYAAPIHHGTSPRAVTASAAHDNEVTRKVVKTNPVSNPHAKAAVAGACWSMYRLGVCRRHEGPKVQPARARRTSRARSRIRIPPATSHMLALAGPPPNSHAPAAETAA